MKVFFRIIGYMRPYTTLFAATSIGNILLGAFGALTMAIVQPILTILFEEGSQTSVRNVQPNVYQTNATTYIESLKHTFYDIIQSYVIDNDKNITLLRLSIFLVSIFLIKNIIKYTTSILSVQLSERVIRDMRYDAFRSLMRQSMSYFSSKKTGDLMALITNEVGMMHGSVTPFLSLILRNPIEILLLVTLLLSMSVKLTLIAFSTSIVTLFLVRIAKKYLRKYAERMANATAGFTSTLQESISGMRVIKSYSAEDNMNKRFWNHSTDYVRSAIKMTAVNDITPSISEIFAISALSIVLYVGGQEVFGGQMRGADLITFLFALFAVMSPVAALVSIPSQIQRGIVAAQRVFAMIDTDPTITDGSVAVPHTYTTLEISNLVFGYSPERAVLRDISLTIHRGETVAFVGTSGSGKSTLIDVIVRFYDPNSGMITLDGIDIREFPVTSYRSLFGIVPQEAFLFNDTIANNISFGLPDVHESNIKQAAIVANADEFIQKLVNGYTTFVGDRGVMLSGGQRQRIAIARAVAHAPEILIFDEATSALDSNSEKIVQSAINSVLRDKTAIIIAHRLSTIVDCDKIVVFDEGQIVEQGTHAQLLEKGGLYHHLYSIQYNEKND